MFAAATSLIPVQTIAAALDIFSEERSLSFHNLHTGEEMKVNYWEHGRYMPQALADINYILRDYRTGELKEIDTDLLDLLFTLRRVLENKNAFTVISGYRSPETNSFLHAIGRGVVKNSMHLYGKAIDIRLPGCELKNLRREAVNLKRGGVGYYPASDFVHVDVGRVRYW